jgi:hypothetical protein
MQRRDPFKISLLLLLISTGLVACASQQREVEFIQVLLPNRDDIGRLAVVLDGEISPRVQESIIESLKACPLYSEVKFIDKPLNLQSEATAEAFDQFLQKNAKGFGGLLRFRMEHLDKAESSEKTLSFALSDLPTYDWYPSFGVPRINTLGFADRFEIGPEVDIRKRNPVVKTNRYTQVYRMSLYHKPLNEIILDRVAKNISSLSLFSKGSGLTRARFENQIRDSVLKDIGFYACPPSTLTVRHIYYTLAQSNVAQLVREGFDAATGGDWDGAARSWNEAIAKDPKNALAHHNLGVYHERLGDTLGALPHYRIGFRDKRVQEDVFGQIVGRSLPSSDPMEASVALVTGGNWIFVDVPAGEKRTRASVFRVTPIVDPDSSRVTGQTLKEIALLRFVTSQESRRAARVREYLLDSPVRPGDMVIFNDEPAGPSSDRSGLSSSSSDK